MIQSLQCHSAGFFKITYCGICAVRIARPMVLNKIGYLNNAITMPNELLGKVAHEVLPTADEYLLTVSGEPLASPNFAQFVQEFLPYGAKLELHTNGTLFTSEEGNIL
jgi:organic radical activating enzyme